MPTNFRKQEATIAKSPKYQYSKSPEELIVIQSSQGDKVVHIARVREENPLSFEVEDEGERFTQRDFIVSSEYSRTIQELGINEFVREMTRKKIKVRCNMSSLMDDVDD